jgi:regulator of protease activity HflC (stomatin/prohibitin superfamily)
MMDLDELNFKKLGILIGGGVLLLTLGLSSFSLFETNDEGFYQVKQAAMSGSMSVRQTAGTYLQAFGTITTYQVSDSFSFDKKDGAEPLNVRFQDGGTATISGSVRFRLSANEGDQLSLHRDYKSYDTVKSVLIKQAVTEALIQTASMFKAEESYASRRSEFTSLVEDQIKEGLYETIANEVKEKDVDGNEFNDTNIVVVKDKNGNRVIKKTPLHKRYNVDILQLVIKEIDFDETIDNLIAKKKEAEQQKVVARANAERAKQDAITARERAAAEVAVAKGLEEVEKIKAVTKAQKEFEVAQLEKKKAEEDARASEIKGQAEARINQLKVNAGLTPQERAEYEVRKADVVSKNLASIKLPSMMVIGGGNGSATDPFAAVGLESLMRISGKLTNGN